MATFSDWVAGARPRTLPLAIAPVAVGTAAATVNASVLPVRAGLAAVVAIALQIGVNYANDYSDGVRGTDADRRGPMRLTASGVATPAAVRRAALAALAGGAVAGGVLALMVDLRLLALGVVAIAAAWGYTGGRRPYGYSGFGELAVLAFFGFAACVGSAYVQHQTVPAAAWWGSLAVGLPACAVLMANNIRDIDGDTVAGKRTLAVRLGRPTARGLYVACLGIALLAVIPIALDETTALLSLLAAPLAITPARIVLRSEIPPELVAALIGTVRFTIALALLLTVGFVLG